VAKTIKPDQLPNPVPLTRFERVIPSGLEWNLATPDWVVLQLSEGIAYVFDSKGNRELPLGGVIVCPPKSRITLTASVLEQAQFRGMSIRVSSLIGFLTALERQCLEKEVARKCAPFLEMQPDHPLAARVTQLLAEGPAAGLTNRLAFAQTFAEMVAPQLHEALNQGMRSDQNQQEAKGRLRQLLTRMPESELCSLSLETLASQLHCCERHASRLFREEWGTGFPTYVSEIRLKKACQLLLQVNLKIIDVALESGHGSLAHFNYVFKKRFHKTPTKWRVEQTAPGRHPRARLIQMAAAVVWLLLSAAGLSNRLLAQEAGGGTTHQPVAVVAGANGVTDANTDRNTDTNAVAGTNAVASTNAVSPNAAAPTTIQLNVERYEVIGNTLLATNVISSVLAPYTGEAESLDALVGKITNAMGALQLEYSHRGWITAKVSFPPQVPTNGVVLFEVTEGKLTTIRISRNRFFSSNNIMAQLPYLRGIQSSNGLLNSKVFQTELDRANLNPDRQILPELRPGLEPGISALILDVTDHLPLHGRLEWDNYSPPGTPELRINANASYANLWDLGHTLGMQYGFSPEWMKRSLGNDTYQTYNVFDNPEVCYYSGFYRMPFGSTAGAADQIAQDPTHFGYNETTKQFVQPPAIGRPEFSAYGSRSTTGPTIAGLETPVVNNPGSTLIEQQLITQQYTAQTTVGGRFTFPLPTWQGIQSSWSFGMDYKDDKVATMPTNFFYIINYVQKGNNPDSPRIPIPFTIAAAGASSHPSLHYIPLFLGWNGSRQDHWGQGATPSPFLWSRFDGGVSLVAGTGGLISHDTAFPYLIANTTEASKQFVAVRPQLSRTQVLPGKFTFYGSLAGQWANEPLLNLEQFELGGNGSVRGYREGELYADTGWVGQAELRSPVFWRGGTNRNEIGTQLTVFTDYGEGYQLDPVAQHTYQALWGTGAGVNLNIGHYMESHILVAWPLMNSEYSGAGRMRISFSMSAKL
jgi:hemolysin activation/secretion protein/AraC-like DNA-binding protein